MKCEGRSWKGEILTIHPSPFTLALLPSSPSLFHSHRQLDVNFPAFLRGGEAPLLHLPGSAPKSGFICAAARGCVNVHDRAVLVDCPLEGES